VKLLISIHVDFRYLIPFSIVCHIYLKKGFGLKFGYLKRFFSVFFVAYFIVVATKFLFLYYLSETFGSFSTLQSVSAIFWGYKFDFASASVVAFLATLFDFNKRAFATVTSLLLLTVFFIQVGDILYFDESSRHIGYEITDTFTDANSLFMTAYSQHTAFTILAMIIGLALFMVSFRWFIKSNPIELNRYYLLKKLSLVLLTIFFIRGMTQHIPLNPWQSNQIGESKLAMLSLNSVYNVVYVLSNSKKKLQPMVLPTVEQEIQDEAFKALYRGINKGDFAPFKEKPNVVFLFLESWSAVNMKSYGYKHETTPFYDALLQKSVRPKAMIASGHRTTEGLFATLTSLQNPLGKSVAKSNLQSFSYSSIVEVLVKKSGYGSAFFQGSAKETSGTGSLAQALGFQGSYGKRDVTKRRYEENYWGVHDPDLYDFALEKIEQIKKPFVVGINGATTHDDKTPNGVEKLKFVDDERKNAQLNALHFSDKALGEFVTSVEKQYPNTLFVLFADHCGGVKGSSFENYLIPFALYHKKLTAKAYDVYLSQRDIAPMVYDLVYGDYHESNMSFSGKSLFSDEEFFADYYHNGVLGWVEDDEVLEVNIATNQERCYKVIHFKDQEQKCEDDIMAKKNRAFSFTNVSQKLLFSGETEKFKAYRKLK
jgi:phosphoglycerol transferase MdoB-like AlkP superfamily enzyme